MALLPQVGSALASPIYSWDSGLEYAAPYESIQFGGTSDRHIIDLDGAYARTIDEAPISCTAIYNTVEFGRDRLATYLDLDREIRGTVKDSADNPLQRIVIVMTQDGYLLGRVRSAADGTFTIRCNNFDPTARTVCLALPDIGDQRNAAIKWGVIPAPRL